MHLTDSAVAKCLLLPIITKIALLGQYYCVSEIAAVLWFVSKTLLLLFSFMIQIILSFSTFRSPFEQQSFQQLSLKYLLRSLLLVIQQNHLWLDLVWGFFGFCFVLFFYFWVFSPPPSFFFSFKRTEQYFSTVVHDIHFLGQIKPYYSTWCFNVLVSFPLDESQKGHNPMFSGAMFTEAAKDTCNSLGTLHRKADYLCLASMGEGLKSYLLLVSQK